MRAIYSLIFMLTSMPLMASSLSLGEAIKLSLEHDPQLKVSEYQERALQAQSIVAGQLPDPRVSIAIANLPLDTLDTDQEPMTQLKVGVKQLLSRGDSLGIKQQQLIELSRQYPYQRQARHRDTTLVVSQHWLNVLKYQKTITLIEQDRKLFEQLVEIAESNYASALGSATQQDIVSAELALTRLDERLLKQRQQYQAAKAQLFEWLPNTSINQPLSKELPAFTLASEHSSQDYLLQHPQILMVDQKILAGQQGVKLANESHKPQWGLEASYGYRDDSANGIERADFLSVGVSFDVPLSRSKLQDQYVESAVAEREALKTERILLLRTMQGQVESAKAHLKGLNQRYDLYQQRLLKQTQEQAEAALNAYTSDNGSFSDVMRARIDVLNARIDTLVIQVERLQTVARLHYFIQPFSQAKAQEQQ